jgi:phospholipase/carboxylesterase
VPLPRGEAARDHLQALGYSVEWRTYPMAHQVDAQEIVDMGQWLLERLAQT